jgi:hypothetical protein
MGWYLILNCSCTILPEFVPFIEKGYLRIAPEEWEKDDKQKEYDTLPKSYRDLIDIWNELELSYFIDRYELNGSQFKCGITKKVTTYNGDLEEAYSTFIDDIIVTISSEISQCSIYDDSSDITRIYTDSELRNTRFSLGDKVKTIEHTYNEDKTEIIETRVIYKHNIKKIQFIDLNREYGFKR